MRVRNSAFTAICAAVLTIFAVQPAIADQPATPDNPATLIEGSVSSIGLSPGNVYGPWQFATIDIRGESGADDKPGFTFVTRHDGDSGFPSSGTTYILDDYHQFSPKFSSYAQVEASSGTVFPSSGAYVELDPTVIPNLVIAGGYGYLRAYPGLSQSYVNVGPQLYFPHGSVTVRYVPLWTQGQVSASSFQGALSLGDEGTTLSTLAVQDGVVPAYDVQNPIIAQQFQDKVFAADLTVKHWIKPRLGVEFGLGISNARNRFTGASIYDSFGGMVGLFIGVGHNPNMP